MKNKNKLRILGIALILSLLFAVLPASPAWASASVTPASQMVGARLTFSVSGYTAYVSSDTLQYYCDVYITDQAVSLGSKIDTNITRYKGVAVGTFIDDGGTATGSFNVPSSINEGAGGIASPLPVTAGSSYSVVFTERYSYVGGTVVQNKTAKFTTTFTVAQGPTLDALTPASGTPGTDVTVSGFNFPLSTAIVYKFDTTVLAPKSGHTITTAGGSFLGVLTIPATATAGVHNIIVTAGTGSASATFTVSAPASLSPLSPASGAAGSDVTITGANFPANMALTITFDTTPITPKAGSLQVGSNGSFMSIVTVPATAAAGTYLFTVSAGASSVTASFAVTGTGPTATPTAPPTTTATPTTTTTPTGTATIDFLTPVNTVGGSVTIFGTDFTPGLPVVFKYDEVQIATAMASAKGIVSATFTLPASVHGDHTITATDGVVFGTLTFTIESTAPGVPSPLLPLMNAKVKSPVLFDWADVTDESAPVTYNLQIGTDATFAAGTIIIDKSKLATSQYTLTDVELGLLSNPSATYYWRESATDAAQNQSPWTGAGAFTVSQPLKFTGWPMYATMAGIAVVAFLLGLLLGRRTALSY